MMYSTQKEWQDYYNSVKSENWPPCETELHIRFLPDAVRRELKKLGYNFFQRYNKTWTTTGIDKFNVLFHDELDGGGTDFGRDYALLIKKHYPERIFNTCLDWCSGPGFIGLDILSHRLCKNVCLLDMNWEAIDYAEQTIANNNLKDKVYSYLLRNLELLPADEQFDLVVSNSPHFNERRYYYGEAPIFTDPEFGSHKTFFKQIKKHLSPDGIILLQQYSGTLDANTFEKDLEQAGLKITNTYPLTSKDYKITGLFYLEIVHI